MNFNLSRFKTRVRFLRAWRFGMIGLLAASLICAICLVGDRLHVVTFEPAWSLFVLAGGLVLGALTGLAWPLADLDLAQSIDRRTGNFDRLSTAMQVDPQNSFGPLLQRDAEHSLVAFRASQVFPFQLRRIDFAACGACLILAAAIYSLQTGLFLTPAQKADLKEMEQLKAQVHRVTREIASQLQGADGEKVSAAIKRFERELNRGQLNREEALQKAQALADEASKLTQTRIERAAEKAERLQARALQQQFEKAGGDLGKLKDLSLDKLQQSALNELMEKTGAKKLPSENLDEKTLNALGMDDSTREMMKLSADQKRAISKAMADEMAEIQQQLESQNLTGAQRKALEEKKRAIEKLTQQLKLSDEVKKALEELQNMKEYREFLKARAEMEKMQRQLESGDPPTEEQIKELQDRLEKFAEMMKDPAFREELKKAFKEMTEAIKAGKMTSAQVQALMGLLGGSGGPGDGGMFQGQGENQKGDPMSLDSKGNPTAIRGERDEKRGTDAYQEIKAPTTIGSRTSVPYSKVLPQYRETAENAVSNNQVETRHRKRVKDYFESLSGGK